MYPGGKVILNDQLSKSAKTKTIAAGEDASDSRLLFNGQTDPSLSQSSYSSRQDSLFEAAKQRPSAQPVSSNPSGLQKHEMSEAKTAPGQPSTPSEPDAAGSSQSAELSASSLRSSSLL